MSKDAPGTGMDSPAGRQQAYFIENYKQLLSAEVARLAARSPAEVEADAKAHAEAFERNQHESNRVLRNLLRGMLTKG